MGDLTAVVLPSGMGVRFRNLTPTESDKILFAAGKELLPGSSVADLLAAEAKLAVEAMVKQVTRGACKKSKRDPKDEKSPEEFDVNHPSNDWTKFNPDAYEEFISDVRDHEALKGIFRARCKLAPGEVDAILGKAVTVTSP